MLTNHTFWLHITSEYTPLCDPISSRFVALSLCFFMLLIPLPPSSLSWLRHIVIFLMRVLSHFNAIHQFLMPIFKSFAHWKKGCHPVIHLSRSATFSSSGCAVLSCHTSQKRLQLLTVSLSQAETVAHKLHSEYQRLGQLRSNKPDLCFGVDRSLQVVQILSCRRKM